nr:MAG TPA: Protein of unknown function (DUF3963) [Caudoviricetes sp.]
MKSTRENGIIFQWKRNITCDFPLYRTLFQLK